VHSEEEWVWERNLGFLFLKNNPREPKLARGRQANEEDLPTLPVS
jgi:hypothetical protein